MQQNKVITRNKNFRIKLRDYLNDNTNGKDLLNYILNYGLNEDFNNIYLNEIARD